MTNLQSTYKGERFVATKVDDLTVRFHSPAGPWAGQLRETFEGYPQPAHYLEQHHPDFAEGKTWEDFRARPLPQHHPGDTVVAGLDPPSRPMRASARCGSAIPTIRWWTPRATSFPISTTYA